MLAHLPLDDLDGFPVDRRDTFSLDSSRLCVSCTFSSTFGCLTFAPNTIWLEIIYQGGAKRPRKVRQRVTLSYWVCYLDSTGATESFNGVENTLRTPRIARDPRAF